MVFGNRYIFFFFIGKYNQWGQVYNVYISKFQGRTRLFSERQESE
jgi:hypothetical protein